jgi:hypothetical protein
MATNLEHLAKIRAALSRDAVDATRVTAHTQPDLLAPVRAANAQGLLSYQVEPAGRLARSLRVLGAAPDCSDMGVGKTYAAVAAFRELGIKPLVICPKSVIPSWGRAAAHLQWPLLEVVNWESIRTGRHPLFLSGRFSPTVRGIIFDEAHRGRNAGTKNSELAIAAHRQRIPSLVLSATLAETPLHFEVWGRVLGLFEEGKFLSWAAKYGCQITERGLEFLGDETHLAALHKTLFPARGVRVRIAELGSQFPDTLITAEAYDADETPEIVAAYSEMETELAEIEAKGARDKYAHQFAVLIRAQQKIEMLKVPLIASLARDAVAEGSKVVIFCNYEESRAALCEKLETQCTVHGGQTGVRGSAERQNWIDRFQRNWEDFCVVNIKAGGVGTSFHDPNGVVPRATLVCPTFSAVDLRQALGRVRRSGGAASIQKIVYVSGTIEEAAAKSVTKKLGNLDALNDGDLRSPSTHANDA